MPDALTVFEDFPDAVQWDVVRPPFSVHQAERLRVVGRKIDLPEWQPDDAILHTVEVAQLEFAAGELRIPTDAIQQFSDHDHDEERFFRCFMSNQLLSLPPLNRTRL
jgi:hypothetical protein